MKNLTGYWTGHLGGTNSGGITLDLKHENENLSGLGKIHEPALGFYEYSIQGKIGDNITLSLLPVRNPHGLVLGRVQAIASLTDDGKINGRWKSEIGTEGVFTVERHDSEKFESNLPKNNSVFIVHGHDEGTKQSVARFLEKLGIEPVILQEQINKGMTVLEKFEAFADRAAYAVVLMTPDDKGYAVGKEEETKNRARQNVVLELGYFAAKLGREKTLVLTRGDVELPSDVFGLVYEKIDQNEGWKMRLARELKESGFAIDMNKVI